MRGGLATRQASPDFADASSGLRDLQQWIEPGAGDAAVELAAERLLAQARGLDQPIEIDAGADADRLEQVDQILGADVAGIAAAVLHLRRMAADAAERAIEIAHAGLVGGERIDQAGAAGVVEMRDQFDAGNLAAQAADQRLDAG